MNCLTNLLLESLEEDLIQLEKKWIRLETNLHHYRLKINV
mgnify:FL=1